MDCLERGGSLRGACGICSRGIRGRVGGGQVIMREAAGVKELADCIEDVLPVVDLADTDLLKVLCHVKCVGELECVCV
jgi:hypothetical protein